MIDIQSNRKYKMVWIEGGEVVVKEESLFDIIDGDDWEYHYALQDRIDFIMNMFLGSTEYFQFNRDDKHSKGSIMRIR